MISEANKKWCMKCENMSLSGTRRTCEVVLTVMELKYLDNKGELNYNYTHISNKEFEVPEACPYLLEMMVENGA